MGEMDEMEKNGMVWWIVAVAVGVALSGVLGKVLFGTLLPFASAYVLARLSRPAGLFLSKLWRVGEKTGCTLYAVFVCLGGVVTITLLSGKMVEEAKSLVMHLPEYAEDTVGLIRRLGERLPFSHSSFEVGGTSVSEMMLGAAREVASKLGNQAAGMLTSLVQRFSSGVMSGFAFVLSYIYLTADLPGVTRSVREFLPKKALGWIDGWFGEFSGAVFGYFRAYLLLFFGTFLILALGLSVIGAENAFVLAVVIALIDALPVFGCGTVLLPWALWEFLSDRGAFGVGLVVVWLAAYLARQIAEPRLIGKMSGAHPFVALVFLYAGWKVGGLVGMLVSPIVLMAIGEVKRSLAAETKNPARVTVPDP